MKKRSFLRLGVIFLAVSLSFSARGQRMTNPFILDSCSVQRFVPVLDENGKQSQEGYSFNYRIVYPKALRNGNQQQLQKVLDIYRCIDGGVPLSKDQEESIPQAIEKEIEKETLEYKDYALWMYEDQKDLYVESSRETGEDSTIGILCFELSREVVVKESEGNFICFQSNYTEYKGGAHGMYGTSYLLFDSSSLEVINSEMLFCPGVEEEVNAIISALSGRELSGHDNFYLDENGITYVYNPYQGGCYADGLIEVFVPFYKIADLLKPSILQRYFPQKYDKNNRPAKRLL